MVFDFKRVVARGVVLAVVAIACVSCDQGTKRIAAAELAGERPIDYLSGFVRLTYSENVGAFLGLGSQLSPSARRAASVVVGLLLVAFAAYGMMRKHIAATELVAVSLVVAGGASNLIDRWIHDGYVIDFMVIGRGIVRTGVFNLADVAITSGCVLLIAHAFRRPRREAPRDEEQ